MANALHLHFDEWPFTDSSKQNKLIGKNGVTVGATPELLHINGSGNDLYANPYLAQSFTPDSTWKIRIAECNHAIWSSTGYGKAEIRPDNGGQPDVNSSVLVTSDVVNIGTTQTTGKSFTFSTSISLTSGVLYWLVFVSTDSGGSPSGTINFRRTGASVYSGGNLAAGVTGNDTPWGVDPTFDMRQLKLHSFPLSAGFFDGSSTDLMVNKANSLTPANNENWEIDLLAEHATILGAQTYYSQYEDADNRCKLELLTGPTWGLHFLYRYNGTDLISLSGAGGEITDTDEHHIALSKEGNTFRLFLDGVNVAETTYAFSSSELIDSDIYIGSDGNSANYFNGSMQKIRISNTTRFTVDFTPDMNSTYETDEFTQLLINFSDTAWIEEIGETISPFYTSLDLNTNWWGDGEMGWDGVKWFYKSAGNLTPNVDFRTGFRPTHLRMTYSDVGTVGLRIFDGVSNIINEGVYVSGTEIAIPWAGNDMNFWAFAGATSAFEITSIEFKEILFDSAEAGLSVWNPTQVTRGGVDTGTRIYRFGNQCGYFPGAQSGIDPYALQLADNPNWNIGDREFTLDTWVHPLSHFNYAGIIHQNTRWYWYIDSTGKLNWYIEDGGPPTFSMQSSGTVPIGEWSHIALTRSLELTGAGPDVPGFDGFMLPDSDVSASNLTYGSGTARWDRLNAGIFSGTPDDTNGVHGMFSDDWQRNGFESPSFSGSTTQIKVHVRALSLEGTEQFLIRLYSDGSIEDGNSGLIGATGSFANYTFTHVIAKTAAQLTNLEVRVESHSGVDGITVSEIEVELVGASIPSSPTPGTPDSPGQVWRMYIKGVRQAQTTEKFTIPNLNGPLWIGRGTSTNDLFHGYMDELRLFLDKAIWTDNEFWPYDYPYFDEPVGLRVPTYRRRIHSIKGR